MLTPTTFAVPAFVMKDVYTLCEQFQYNPVEALLEMVTAQYTVEELSTPGRFTMEQLTAIANNGYYKYPHATRYAIHLEFAPYFEPGALIAGLQLTATSDRTMQTAHYDWCRLSVEEKRHLVTLLEKMAAPQPSVARRVSTKRVVNGGR